MRTGGVIAMTWTLIMLAIAFGLIVTAFIGWRQECRDDEMEVAEQAFGKEPTGEGTGVRLTRRAQSTGARHIYANAEP
jgi:hypothetical protein